MKNEIDLSKISVKQLPTKKIKANFDGTEKEFTITALSDGDRATFGSILSGKDDIYRARNLYVLLIASGLGLDQDVAAYLYDNVTSEAIRVAGEVFEFDQSFVSAKNAEAEEAEKNLVDAVIPPELPQVDTLPSSNPA